MAVTALCCFHCCCHSLEKLSIQVKADFHPKKHIVAIEADASALPPTMSLVRCCCSVVVIIVVLMLLFS